MHILVGKLKAIMSSTSTPLDSPSAPPEQQGNTSCCGREAVVAPAEQVMEQGECMYCLQTGGETLCACTTRFAHKACSARWQLQRAGTSEETECR